MSDSRLKDEVSTIRGKDCFSEWEEVGATITPTVASFTLFVRRIITRWWIPVQKDAETDFYK